MSCVNSKTGDVPIIEFPKPAGISQYTLRQALLVAGATAYPGAILQIAPE